MADAEIVIFICIKIIRNVMMINWNYENDFPHLIFHYSKLQLWREGNWWYGKGIFVIVEKELKFGRLEIVKGNFVRGKDWKGESEKFWVYGGGTKHFLILLGKSEMEGKYEMRKEGEDEDKM